MQSHSPHVSIRLHVLYDHPSIASACFLLVVLSNVLSGSHLKAIIIFIFLIFCRMICHPKSWDIIPPMHSTAVSSHHNTSPITDTVFWLVVVGLFIIWWLFTATEWLSLWNILSLKLPSKMMGNHPLPMFPQGRISSKILPHCWYCFGWLLHWLG